MCFKERRIPVMILLVLSVPVFIMGAALVALSFVVTDIESIEEVAKEEEKIGDYRDLVLAILIITGIVTIAVAVFAAMIALCRACKGPFVAGCFGLVVTPLWALILGFGAVSTYVANNLEEWVEDECPRILGQTYAVSIITEPDNTAMTPTDANLLLTQLGFDLDDLLEDDQVYTSDKAGEICERFYLNYSVTYQSDKLKQWTDNDCSAVLDLN